MFDRYFEKGDKSKGLSPFFPNSTTIPAHSSLPCFQRILTNNK
jgi:hypothetical protein